jgi:hypothetical protein
MRKSLFIYINHPDSHSFFFLSMMGRCSAFSFSREQLKNLYQR